MTSSFIITGTDTGIGKTICAALVTLAVDGCYWKAVQTGPLEDWDRPTVQRLTGLPDDRFLPEAYALSEPLSPHRAAELAGVTIAREKLLTVPEVDRTLIIEGAGGLMVPLTRDWLAIELFKAWHLPVILCARTGLGTINHTLLSVKALNDYAIPIHGIIFNGPDNPDNMRTIAEFSGCRILGHIPPMTDINAVTLRQVFAQNFDREAFAA